MAQNHISIVKSENVSDAINGGRLVLYEEIAEYHYRFSKGHFFGNTTIEREAEYHIGNLVLLTLYFDGVLIQTASLFNSVDPFIRDVARSVMNHPKFKEMIASGILKIVGWGGHNSSEMYSAAVDFSRKANPKSYDKEYFSAIAEHFTPENVLSRSEGRPDDEIASLFKKRLEQTTIIRKQEEYIAVQNALDQSLESTGQLVAISFNPILGTLELSAESLSAVGISFLQSNLDNMANELPGVYMYAPLSSHALVDHKLETINSSVRSFLYSPQIFASFLRGYLEPKDFNEILNRPFNELLAVKNGDWQRFANAYHEAIAIVSDNIGHLAHSELSDVEFRDKDKWASSLEMAVSNHANRIDINAFVESLALLSGVIWSVPYLGTLFKAAGVFTREKVNSTFHSIRHNAKSEISPFIKKLIIYYELTGARA